MKMKPRDISGFLYSSKGLRFGGFQTADFLAAVEKLESLRPGVVEEIVAEAHYLIFWLHRFPEISFLLGIILFRSLSVALLMFFLAFMIEILRFYLIGPSLFLSLVCRFWNWVKIPLFVLASIILWPESKFLSMVLIIFLITQGWFDILVSFGTLPIRLVVGRFLYKRYGGHLHNMEGMAMSFVINRWRLKLFPADEFDLEE